MNRYRFHCGESFSCKNGQFAELKNPINVNPPFLPLGALQWYQKTSDCYHTRGKASNKVFDLVNILGSPPFPIIPSTASVFFLSKQEFYVNTELQWSITPKGDLLVVVWGCGAFCMEGDGDGFEFGVE